MFEAPANNSYGAKFYGTAAVSPILFDPDNMSNSWLGEGCGKCWKVTGTANLDGYDTTTTLVLKGANVCPADNQLCSGSNAHFDIAAPGFDVKAYSLAHECEEREPEEKEGFASCSDWMISQQDPTVNCECGKFKDPVLRAGCENFRSLNWDNAPVQYEEVACPFELDRLNCWEENNLGYPFDIPQFCASNVDGPVTPAPTPAPVSSPTTASLTSSPSARPSLRNPPVTPQPTPNPTPNPTPPVTSQPTPNPTQAPVNSPPTDDTANCCSYDGANCHNDVWCGATEARCEGSCGGTWISKTDPSNCRIPKWGDCTNDIVGCCAPSVCTGNSIWYKQCL
jgi:hypothetical protein